VRNVNGAPFVACALTFGTYAVRNVNHEPPSHSRLTHARVAAARAGEAERDDDASLAAYRAALAERLAAA
jgi:hypothetical protein